MVDNDMELLIKGQCCIYNYIFIDSLTLWLMSKLLKPKGLCVLTLAERNFELHFV